MRSDDAAGVLVARALSEREGAMNPDRVLILEAGEAPENRTGTLRRFGPDVVIIVDAADMKEEPGAIRWIPEDAIDGISASTHSLPLSMLARYLQLEWNCAVIILGIQPVSNEVGERVSPEVLQAVEEIANVLDEMIRGID
jgi:hydrogenase 3 maturation protease